MSATPDEHLIRVLALDGGGVRGLSSLLILRELMGRLSLRRGKPVRPCDCFELIIGTGTGGISALFLGRMRMSVDQAIDEYIGLAETAFKGKASHTMFRSRKRKPLLDGAILEEKVGHVVERILRDRDARLSPVPNDQESECQTAVLAATSGRADAPPYVFRSYTDGIRPASTFTIREVARATASTAGLFAPTALGNPPITFVDAGVAGYNNPAEVGLHEAERLWPGMKIKCYVSLGTGLQKIVDFGKSGSRIVEACRAIVENCEQVHDRMLHSLHNGFPYFRFNVDRGLDEVDIMEWNDAGARGTLSGITDSYMRWKEVDNKLHSCVRAINSEDSELPTISHALIAPNVSNNDMRNSRKYLPILNPPPEIFHGRQDDIEGAVILIQCKNVARIAILGAGGIGKTSIALTLLHDERVEEIFKENRRFLTCEGIVSTSSLVDVTCSAFGLHTRSTNRREDLLVFLKHTYTSRPVLLVLDNFETLWDNGVEQTDAEEFLRELASVKLLSLVLTMRGAEHPPGVRWSSTLHIRPLDSAASRLTFVDICGGDPTDGDQLDELLRAVDYVPLAITLMARLGQNDSPAVLLERWTTEQTRLLSQPRDKHRLKSVDISIDMSIRGYRMQSNPDALQLLSAISMLPSGVFDGDLPSICPLMENLDEASTTLREVALAYYDASRTLRVLSPIRLYVLQHHTANQNQLQDVQSYYFQLASQGDCVPGEPGYIEALRTLPRHRENIEAVITGALMIAMEKGKDEGDQAVEAALCWNQFLHTTHPRKTIIELAVQFVQQQPGHPKLPFCLLRLGSIQRWLSEYDASQKSFTAALEASEIPDDIADCLYSLGELQRNISEFRTSRETFLKARQAFEALGNRYQVAWCLYHLGDLQSRAAEYDTAQETLMEARHIFEALNEECGVAACLHSLGVSQRRTHAYDASQDSLTKARLAFEAVNDHQGIALCLNAFGELHKQMGEYDAARKMFLEAREAFEAINNRELVANCLWNLGDIQMTADEYDAAHDTLLDARMAYNFISDRKGVAKCLYSSGKLHQMTNKHNVARETLVEARNTYEALNDQRGVADCLLAISHIQCDASEYDAAQITLTTAQQAFEKLGDRVQVAWCFYHSGYIHSQNSNYDAAQAALADARSSFDAAHDQVGVAKCLWKLANIQHRTYGNALETLDMAQKTFESVNGERGIADCFLTRSHIQCDTFEYDEARVTVMAAQQSFEKLCAKDQVAWCLYHLGHIHFQNAEYDAARAAFTDARRTFEAVDNQGGVAWCLWKLANIQHRTVAYDAARETLDRAQQIFESVNDRNGVADCLLTRSYIQCNSFEYSAAQTTVIAAKQAFGALFDHVQVAWCNLHLGDIYGRNAEYDVARETLMDARQAFEATNDRRGIAESLRYLGRFHHQLRQDGAGREYLTKAIRAFELVNDRKSIADCLLTLGELHISTVEYDAAYQSLTEARKDCRDVSLQTRLARCLWSLATTQRWTVACDTQREILIEARLACEDVNDHFGAADCLLALGKLHVDTGNYDVARETLIDAQKTYESLNERGGYARCLFFLARIQVRTSAHDAAQETLADARRTYEDINDLDGIADCLHALGELRVEIEKYDDAQEAFTEARQIYEDIRVWDRAEACRRSLEEILVQHQCPKGQGK